MKRRLFAFAALFTLLTLPRPADAQADAWWRHITVLAHDSMRGRETGSPEHRKAAEYVAEQFRLAGLTGGHNGGFLQPVAFIGRLINEDQSSLTLVRNGVAEPLTLGADAYFNPRAPLAPRVEGQIVFVGYGLSLPEYGHDDLAGLNLKGKIVAYLSGMPRGVPGPVVSHMRAQSWEVFRERGALGIIVFGGNLASDSAFVRAARNRFNPQMMLADPALDNQRGNRLSVSFNAFRAEQLFAGAPERFATLAARSDSGLPLPHFDLPVSIRSVASVREVPVTSENVVGVLRGSDPRLRDEYLVLSAHLDHVGVGAPVRGDSIYNGAMDNASGSALLIEAARALAAQRGSLKRSILFVNVTAEEKGLLGSRYFANHPTVPASAMVANLNTDMFMPLIPLKMVMANGLEESDMANDARAAGTAVGIPVITDPEPEENRFVRSDQYSFVLRGIPALSLKVGFLRDSPEHAAIKKFRAERYHFPSDDLEQPVDRQAAEDFTRFYIALVRQVANRDTKPAWLDASFFKRLAPNGRTP